MVSGHGRKELQVLKTIIRHSVKVAKEKFNFSFDVRTAKRAVAKAKKLGMLMTLETRKANTNLKGPSIYVWQPYQCQNVPTTKIEPSIEKVAQECEEIKHSKHSNEIEKLTPAPDKKVR